ncbi:glutathionylspermidine synthase family protein [Pseudoroseicyclus aestuarii]|uniref:Glutathionylspermidine synthase n=1 Tax=Pseudoroseicyclus aestuarii TaxID=1795041 RepID=A0A318T1F2_9RHOB|nr:glutathionylspermidine synthase family protein [Pseudoroseicyclus aestuarii]PYE84014.1 glutathionylspermidine synthase [Pseudoroseicyclus aestuarii]
MEKITLPERPDWRAKAEELGFTFADMHGEPYWDETSAYRFSLQEVETRLEDPSTELHAMCREAVAKIVDSEEMMDRLAIPGAHRDLVRDSWRAGEPELYGRFDLAYDGQGPAKLLEYNADTPTSLYESAAFQWLWLEDQMELGVLEAGDDQFNGIHEALTERFGDMFEPDTDLHFTAVGGQPEDYATVEMLGWAAREAGLGAHYLDLQSIGLSTEGQFLDDEERVIGVLFKLYPWEDLLRDDYAERLSASGMRLIEPPWKALLSNKGILPILWQMFEGHPNLLPSYFEGDAPALDRAVRKPLFSREGSSITITEGGQVIEASPDDSYAAGPHIIQEYHPLPVMEGFRPVIGTWIVGETCVGMGLRDDRSRITQDLSRFKPHFIRD